MLTLLYLILILGLLIFVHEFGHFIAAKSIGVYVSEFALGNLFHKKLDFIPFDMLRKRFQKILLDLLEKDIGKSNFRYIKNLIYSKYNNGFYVRAKKNEFPNSKKAISYILRILLGELSSSVLICTPSTNLCPNLVVTNTRSE